MMFWNFSIISRLSHQTIFEEMMMVREQKWNWAFQDKGHHHGANNSAGKERKGQCHWVVTSSWVGFGARGRLSPSPFAPSHLTLKRKKGRKNPKRQAHPNKKKRGKTSMINIFTHRLFLLFNMRKTHLNLCSSASSSSCCVARFSLFSMWSLSLACRAANNTSVSMMVETFPSHYAVVQREI